MGTVLIVGFALLLFLLLIILHEYGHFLVAKRNGVEVEEFGIGFPPKLYGKTMGKGIFRSYYTINLLPLGGFVRLRGENDTASGDDTYGSKSVLVKAKIILAGVVVNYIIAVLLFTFLALIGIPKLLPAEPVTSEEQFTIASDTKIIESRAVTSFISENSPADKAGLKNYDRIVGINEQDISNNKDLVDSTKNYAGQTVDLHILRDGKAQTLTASIRSKDEVDKSRLDNESCNAEERTDCEHVKGYLGVVATDFTLQRSTWSAPITGVALSVQYTKVTLQGLWGAVSALLTGDTETASQSVAGPLGIFVVLKEGSAYGMRFILMIMAIISLTLAIMNTLPIPALDGGRLMLTVLFRKILKRPLTKSLEEKIVGTSMLGLLGLMALITVVDIKRFF